ncbi:hypothetical protein AAFF_G00212960 [Aldrovandia affinis]|uniref:Uncharacterized protein n=1 Tax=Aldrovandia affinis TaxID=143900 RepID=A0AAD7RH21_9TELE|nr:hypothetical protein AAFF_G00212960 [Aldrovandia affinis]
MRQRHNVSEGVDSDKVGRPSCRFNADDDAAEGYARRRNGERRTALNMNPGTAALLITPVPKADVPLRAPGSASHRHPPPTPHQKGCRHNTGAETRPAHT